MTAIASCAEAVKWSPAWWRTSEELGHHVAMCHRLPIKEGSVQSHIFGEGVFRGRFGSVERAGRCSGGAHPGGGANKLEPSASGGSFASPAEGGVNPVSGVATHELASAASRVATVQKAKQMRRLSNAPLPLASLSLLLPPLVNRSRTSPTFVCGSSESNAEVSSRLR